MASSRLFKIIVPIDIKSLSMKERICSVLIYTVPLLLVCLFMFSLAYDFFCIVMWILFVILFIPWYYYLLAYEKLEKKYKLKSDIRLGETYEFFSKLMAFSVPGIIITVMTFAYKLGEVLLGLFISSAFIIPAFALYFRDDVFNDENCFEGDDIIMGYNPGGYGLLSAGIGLFGFISAFKSNDPTISVSLVAVTLIFQTLAIAPDKLNRVLFFEVRRIEGYFLLLISLAILFLLMCSVIIGHPAINLNNIDLSFEGIIRKVIIWGTGIILAILYARKIKSMTKK